MRLRTRIGIAALVLMASAAGSFNSYKSAIASVQGIRQAKQDFGEITSASFATTPETRQSSTEYLEVKILRIMMDDLDYALEQLEKIEYPSEGKAESLTSYGNPSAKVLVSTDLGTLSFDKKFEKEKYARNSLSNAFRPIKHNMQPSADVQAIEDRLRCVHDSLPSGEGIPLINSIKGECLRWYNSLNDYYVSDYYRGDGKSLRAFKYGILIAGVDSLKDDIDAAIKSRLARMAASINSREFWNTFHLVFSAFAGIMQMAVAAGSAVYIARAYQRK